MAGKVVWESRSEIDTWSIIEPVLEKYAKLLDVDILVSNPHGESSEPEEDPGQLYIRFWSTQEGGRTVEIPEAYSITLGDGQHDALNPSGEGKEIRDPSGTVVAEIVGGTLYVLFDLPHEGGNEPDELMEHIMEDYMNQSNKTKGIAPQKKLSNLEAFVELFRRRDGLLVIDRPRIKQKWNDLVTAAGSKPKVVKKRIHVTLGPITWRDRDDDEKRRLGKFDFVMNTQTNEVRFVPLSHAGMEHPHVEDMQGNVCLGNAEDGMTSMIKNREFALAVELARIFLETA